MTLKDEFHQECLDGYLQAKKELGYNATYFLQVVSEHGGVQAAKMLLNKREVPEGLMTMWHLGRLDMSLENGVLNPRYVSLFTAAERDIARKRLRDLDYTPKW
jgi:hypothetical protein